MKRIVSILLAIIMAFSMCGAAFAAGSPTVDSMSYFVPAYAITEMTTTPDVAFAHDKLVYFLGENYAIYEAFDLNVDHEYAIVKYVAPTISLDGQYIFLMQNEDHVYYLTPVLIDDHGTETAMLDFTNVEVGIYHTYLVCSESGV